jgi:2-polyprenyl-3-methyl-5-hydroxy-6-metoxy-1,4-benzoquinol methylase
MDEAEYLSLLRFADQGLLAGVSQLGQDRGSEVRLEEDSEWPGELGVLLRESTSAELLRIQYMTERYYAGQIRLAEDDAAQDDLLALAYMRVVRLQFLRCETDMGFTERQLGFVLAVVRQHRAAAGGEPHVLEIGCGAGSLLASLAESGIRRLVGIDLAPSAVELARKRLTPYGLGGNIQRATISHLIKGGYAATFDIVILCDVIEHVPSGRVEALFADVRSLLRPGGHVIAATPNAFAGPHDITRNFRARGFEPEGLHLHEYSLRELTSLLTRTGFSNLAGVRLRDCLRDPAELRLSKVSVPIRLAIERTFRHVPVGLVLKTTEKLYFSGLSGQAARLSRAGHAGRATAALSARPNSR